MRVHCMLFLKAAAFEPTPYRWILQLAMSLSKPILQSLKRPARATAPARPKKKPAAASSGLLSVMPPHPAHTQVPLDFLAHHDAAHACAECDCVYASDCSGLDGGAFALQSLSVSYLHLFGSELDAGSQKVFKALHRACRYFFDDCTRKELTQVKQTLQQLRKTRPSRFIYTAGFPCQPYSAAGARGGDRDSRSGVVWGVLLTISDLSPDVFILENVPELAESKEYRSIFLQIVDMLQRMNDGQYYLDWAILDSYEVAQVPARRRRLYMVGVMKTSLRRTWEWPGELPSVSLASILQQRLPSDTTPLASLPTTGLKNIVAAKEKVEKKDPNSNFFQEPYVVDLANSETFGVSVTYDMLPTITKAHAGHLWVSNLQDCLKVSEVLAAQGFNFSKADVVPALVSDSKLFGMAGDAFTVPVIARLLESLLPALGVSV